MTAVTDRTPENAPLSVGEALQPCPFCGGEAKRVTLGSDDGAENDGGDVIVCTGKCGCSSHVEFGRKENLVSLWNDRQPTQPVGEPEGWREALRRKRDRVHASNRRSDLPLTIKLTFGELEEILASSPTNDEDHPAQNTSGGSHG